jgi:tetratricopeptide (TPR) repeat protein
MNTRFNARPGTLSTILFLLTACPLLAQTTPQQRIIDAFELQKAGQPAPAIVELQTLLDSHSLDALSSGKAWNILGLAYQDQGEFALSQHAYQQSLRILEALPNNIRDYSMALDDFGGLYMVTGQYEIADKMRKRALGLYEKVEDHGGAARASSNLASIAFSQKKVVRGSKYLERAVKEARAANDLDNDDRAMIASLQGWQALFKGDYTMSIANYRRAIDLSKQLHGEEHPNTGWGHLLLGRVEAEGGQLTTALTEMKQGIDVLGRVLGRQNPRYLTAEIAYSRVLDAAGAHSEAAQIRATAETVLTELYRRQCAGCTISTAAFQ